jgi:hypothetical protein
MVLDGGERPAVVFWWWGKWLSEVGVGGFGFREERDGGGMGNGCTTLKNEGERGRNVT